MTDGDGVTEGVGVTLRVGDGDGVGVTDGVSEVALTIGKHKACDGLTTTDPLLPATSVIKGIEHTSCPFELFDCTVKIPKNVLLPVCGVTGTSVLSQNNLGGCNVSLDLIVMLTVSPKNTVPGLEAEQNVAVGGTKSMNTKQVSEMISSADPRFPEVRSVKLETVQLSRP